MNYEDLVEAASDLVAKNEERKEIRALLDEEFPDEMERLGELDKEIANAQSVVKGLMRSHGASETIFGFDFRVGKGPKKIAVDEAGVLDRAEENGHLSVLVEAGFVKYAFDPKQVDRLPPKLKAIYSGYLEETEGTKRTFIPKDLS